MIQYILIIFALVVVSQAHEPSGIRPQKMISFANCMKENCSTLKPDCEKDQTCLDNSEKLNESIFQSKDEDCVAIMAFFKSKEDNSEFPALSYLNCLEKVSQELTTTSQMSNKMYQCNCMCAENPENSGASQCQYLKRKVQEEKQQEKQEESKQNKQEANINDDSETINLDEQDNNNKEQKKSDL